MTARLYEEGEKKLVLSVIRITVNVDTINAAGSRLTRYISKLTTIVYGHEET